MRSSILTNDAALELRSTATGFRSAEDTIAVAIGGADVAVERKIVIQWRSGRGGNDSGCECRLQKAHVRLVGGRAEKRVRHTVIVDCNGNHATSVGRVTPNAIHAVHVLHKCGIDTAVARPAAPSIQLEETLAGRLKEVRVGPLVHGLEDRDVSDSGRCAKGASLHAGAYDAQDTGHKSINKITSGMTCPSLPPSPSPQKLVSIVKSIMSLGFHSKPRVPIHPRPTHVPPAARQELPPTKKKPCDLCT